MYLGKILFCLSLFLTVSAFGNVDKIRDTNAKKEIISLQSKLDSVLTEIETAKAEVTAVPRVVVGSDTLLLFETPGFPDLYTVVLGVDTFQVPVKDGYLFVTGILEFERENRGNWPTSFPGWLSLVSLTIVGGRATQVITSGRKVYKALKPFIGNPLGLVALSSVAISALIAFIVGQFITGNGFSVELWVTIGGYVAIGAWFIYERLVKKGEKETAVKVVEEK